MGRGELSNDKFDGEAYVKITFVRIPDCLYIQLHWNQVPDFSFHFFFFSFFFCFNWIRVYWVYLCSMTLWSYKGQLDWQLPFTLASLLVEKIIKKHKSNHIIYDNKKVQEIKFWKTANHVVSVLVPTKWLTIFFSLHEFLFCDFWGDKIWGQNCIYIILAC